MAVKEKSNAAQCGGVEYREYNLDGPDVKDGKLSLPWILDSKDTCRVNDTIE